MSRPLRRASSCSIPHNHSRTRIWRHSTFLRRQLIISTSRADSLEIAPPEASSASIPDAKFEVDGSSSSLLSVSLAASQYLYSRRGTLAGLAGRAENTSSTLSILGPLSRAILRIPFLYQKITSTTPVTALIATNAPNTAITIVHLDGTTDWMLAAPTLLAWTGQTLSLKPTVDYRLGLAHWGHTEITGRGLLALVGRGSISELVLKEGESYVAHPRHVVAYSISSHRPLPYRFKSSYFRLQIPNVLHLLPEIKFIRVMRQSDTWQALQRVLFTLRIWARRTIWGDGLFLKFQGPATVLLQSRASKITDILTSQNLEDSAQMEPDTALSLASAKKSANANNNEPSSPSAAGNASPSRTASVSEDGSVVFSSVNRPKS